MTTPPDGRRPRLIALDLDGTLVPQSGGVPDGVAAAIQRVHAEGAIVVAATGRSLTTTGYVARDAGMHEYAIVSNGAMIVTVDPETVVEALTFDASLFTAKNNLVLARGAQRKYDLPVITMTQTERAQLLYTLALTAIKQGDVNVGKGLLQDAIATNPQYFEAAERSLAALGG